ncbi:class I SAM-dependent methyltransferase [Blastococcus jejuensis]|uniref:Class I SAM-dependent methyltransferase n=1 Tax=Blastococcus jejuensis TaxID=351224 RepID=A0ABP6PNC2_9ACTN
MGAGGRSAAWEERARSFGAAAAQYAVLRPTYPADAVAAAVEGGVPGPRRVLDLGAGTGLLTGVLVAAGHEVVAVDPAPEMLAQLADRFPGVTTAVGSAETIPVPDAAVDVVVAGQAAHWFDPVPAATEMRRVLRPGGTVALVWNQRDVREPWVAVLDDLLTAENSERPDDRQVVAAFAAALDADVTVAESRIVQRSTPEEFVASFETRSFVITMAEQQRAEFLGQLRALVATHPGTRGRDVVELPYVTFAYRLTPR